MRVMKVISMEDAQARLPAVCDEALRGEIIRLQVANGTQLELTPIFSIPALSALSAEKLAEGYNDEEWAAFENRCGGASD